jgi:eukaryotic-like serine/threonine-protein kinase
MALADTGHDDDDRPTVPGSWGPAQLLVPLRPGGFGDVYVARLDDDAGSERLVVLKRLTPSMQLDVGDVLASVGRVKGRRLPGVVDVVDAGVHGGFGWVATGFIAGIDLQTWRERGGSDDAVDGVAMAIALGILDGLESLHRAGLVHRDISPANVVVGVDGSVTLVDIDLVVPVGTAATDAIPGTPSCMSPEQAQGLPVDGRADLLAWGIVVTELFTGAPFYGDLGGDDVWRLARTGGYRPWGFARLPEGLRAVLQRALAPDPVDRFADAAATRAALMAAWPGRATPGEVASAVEQRAGARLQRLRELITTAQQTPRPLPSVAPRAVEHLRGAVEVKDGYTDPLRRVAPPRDASASVMRPRSAQGLSALVVVAVVLVALAAVLILKNPLR